MPIYEYVCKGCDTKFDHLARSMSETAKPKCPDCGSPKTHRALSVFAVKGDAGTSSGSESGAGHVHSAGCGHCGGAPGSCST